MAWVGAGRGGTARHSGSQPNRLGPASCSRRIPTALAVPKGQERPFHPAHHRHGGRAVGRELASADRLQKTIKDSGGFLALAAIHRSMVPSRRRGAWSPRR